MAVQEQMMMYSAQNLGFTTDWLLGEPPSGGGSFGYTGAETADLAAGFHRFYCQDHDEKMQLGFQDMGFVHGGESGHDDLFGSGDDAAPSSSMDLFHGSCLRGCFDSPHDYCTSSTPLAVSLASKLHEHRCDIDSFLRVQGERLRCAVEQQREKQMGQLLERIESRAVAMMKEKENSLITGWSKTKELEEWLSRVETESEAWKRAAKENEAMAMELNSTLQHIKQTQWLIHLSSSQSIIEDEESAHEGDSSRHEAKDETGARRMKGWCRGCNVTGACSVFLPCKHLCCCKSCDGFLQFCPVCHSPKQTSIEVHLP
ncbi:putative BOI-related E3 ubiquitin-protein ligase 3 [Drosera capensis]